MERRPEFHGSLAALSTKRKRLLAIRQVQYERNYQEKTLLEELFQQNEDMFLLLHNLLQDNSADLKRYVQHELSSAKDAGASTADFVRYVREEISTMKDAQRVATAELRKFVRQEIASFKDGERAATPELKRYVCEGISKAKVVDRPTPATTPTPARGPPKELSQFTTEKFLERTRSRTERNTQVRPRILASAFASSPKRKIGTGNLGRSQPCDTISKRNDDNTAKILEQSPRAEESARGKSKAQDPRRPLEKEFKIPFESEDPPLPPATEVAEESDGNGDNYDNHNMSDGDMVTQPPSTGNGGETRTRRPKSKDSSGSGSEGRLKKKRRRKRPRLSLLELQPEPALEKSLENDDMNEGATAAQNDNDGINEGATAAPAIVKEEDSSIPNTPERPKRNHESICIPETPEPPSRSKGKKKAVFIPETPESPKLPISKKKQAALGRKSLPPKTPVNRAANGNSSTKGKGVQSSVKFTRTAPSPRGLVFDGFRTPEDVHRAMRMKATEKKQREMGYAAKETVLGKARRALEGYECHECEAWFNAEAAGDENPEERKKQLLKHCKHRARKPPPATPPDYWKLSFDETQTQPPPTEQPTPARKKD